MNSATIIAYHLNGGVYCPDCITKDDEQNEECSPVFADSLEQEIGATCGQCHCCMNEHGEFINGDDITDPRFYRWSTCYGCNDQIPHDINGYGYRDARLRALQGKLECRNCLKPTVHF
jgi:hypothetical protein